MRALSCDSLVSHDNVKETTQKKRSANVAATKGLRVSLQRLRQCYCYCTLSFCLISADDVSQAGVVCCRLL